MTDINTTLNAFLETVKTSQVIWALQDKASEDWVVLDSPNFENSDVMPLWSTEELAKQHCIDEWQDYIPAEISLSDWFEFWLEDLGQDNIIVGINWQGEQECVEMELAEFSQALAKVESLK